MTGQVRFSKRRVKYISLILGQQQREDDDVRVDDQEPQGPGPDEEGCAGDEGSRDDRAGKDRLSGAWQTGRSCWRPANQRCR
jgi:hypothetical protein